MNRAKAQYRRYLLGTTASLLALRASVALDRMKRLEEKETTAPVEQQV